MPASAHSRTVPIWTPSKRLASRIESQSRDAVSVKITLREYTNHAAIATARVYARQVKGWSKKDADWVRFGPETEPKPLETSPSGFNFARQPCGALPNCSFVTERVSPRLWRGDLQSLTFAGITGRASHVNRSGPITGGSACKTPTVYPIPGASTSTTWSGFPSTAGKSSSRKCARSSGQCCGNWPSLPFLNLVLTVSVTGGNGFQRRLSRRQVAMCLPRRSLTRKEHGSRAEICCRGVLHAPLAHQRSSENQPLTPPFPPLAKGRVREGYFQGSRLFERKIGIATDYLFCLRGTRGSRSFFSTGRYLSSKSARVLRVLGEIRSREVMMASLSAVGQGQCSRSAGI